MLDHLTLHVADLERSKRLYEAALRPLGYRTLMEFGGEVAGLGAERPDLWIAKGGASGPVHIAFASSDRSAVDAFHREALTAGGCDNGKPGLRPDYHPNYYGAFVLDPDGNNIEAVCHRPG
jgi:catechol 2,3-dioxygenase-like lactoylglutathione lyase family enzyme